VVLLRSPRLFQLGCPNWWAAVHKPERFITLLARVAPKQVFADVTHRPVLTSAEVEAELRERGIPVELLDSLLAAPDELDDDEEPDRRTR
jgi:hypothetical protein